MVVRCAVPVVVARRKFKLKSFFRNSFELSDQPAYHQSHTFCCNGVQQTKKCCPLNYSLFVLWFLNLHYSFFIADEFAVFIVFLYALN